MKTAPRRNAEQGDRRRWAHRSIVPTWVSPASSRGEPFSTRAELLEAKLAHLIVETSYDLPLTDEEHDRLAARLDPCLDAHGARWMRTYLSLDRKRSLCEFEAPDTEAVRSSYRSAHVPFTNVWPAELFARK